MYNGHAKLAAGLGVAVRCEKIDHVHIAVTDLDRAIELFERLTGRRFRDFGEAVDLGFRVVLDDLGLALTGATSTSGPIAEHLRRRGEGVQSVALKVTDLDATVAHWQRCGIRLLGRTEMAGRRAAQFHPKDTFGVMFELEEHVPLPGRKESVGR